MHWTNFELDFVGILGESEELAASSLCMSPKKHDGL